MASIRGPMQSGFSVRLCANIHTFLHEKIDDIRATILTRPHQAGLQLDLRGVRFQATVFIEETFDNIEPTHSSRSLKVQPGAALGEMCRGFPAAVVQRGNQWVPSPWNSVHRCAVLQQDVE